MTLQPTQIHDDGVRTAGRRTAKPHIPDSIGNAEKKYGGQFCEATGEKQGKLPKSSLSRNSSHKTRKTSQKPPQKTTRRLPDDISHVYAVQCMPQMESRRCL